MTTVQQINEFGNDENDIYLGCGGDLTNYKGSFASTMYPQKTKSLEYCEYTIKVSIFFVLICCLFRSTLGPWYTMCMQSNAYL